jgi:ectoine hydroxylase
MYLTPQQVQEYRTNGVLVLDELFDDQEVESLQEAFERDCRVPGEHRVTEQGSDDVRAVYASHYRQREFAALVRSPRILEPVHQLLADDVYVYQFKINAKPAMSGDKWSWHQDYVAWKVADKLPTPRLVNVGFFLDHVTEFNGPVIFVPGSHRHGLVREGRHAVSASEQHLDPDDIALNPSQMAGLVSRYGMVSPKGRAGSVVLFDPQIVHGSAANMSPFQRRLLIVTYNDVQNTPLGVRRPDYLVCRDTTPLRAVDEPLAGKVPA